VVIILLDTDELEGLRARLEDQYEEHSERLAMLLGVPRRRRPSAEVAAALATSVASAQLVLADTAGALRRMAEGSYGTCESCTTPIPLEHLELTPTMRLCQACR
jgi:DnaK suppressor protein